MNEFHLILSNIHFACRMKRGRKQKPRLEPRSNPKRTRLYPRVGNHLVPEWISLNFQRYPDGGNMPRGSVKPTLTHDDKYSSRFDIVGIRKENGLYLYKSTIHISQRKIIGGHYSSNVITEDFQKTGYLETKHPINPISNIQGSYCQSLENKFTNSYNPELAKFYPFSYSMHPPYSSSNSSRCYTLTEVTSPLYKGYLSPQQPKNISSMKILAGRCALHVRHRSNLTRRFGKAAPTAAGTAATATENKEYSPLDDIDVSYALALMPARSRDKDRDRVVNCMSIRKLAVLITGIREDFLGSDNWLLCALSLTLVSELFYSFIETVIRLKCGTEDVEKKRKTKKKIGGEKIVDERETMTMADNQISCELSRKTKSVRRKANLPNRKEYQKLEKKKQVKEAKLKPNSSAIRGLKEIMNILVQYSVYRLLNTTDEIAVEDSQWKASQHQYHINVLNNPLDLSLILKALSIIHSVMSHAEIAETLNHCTEQTFPSACFVPYPQLQESELPGTTKSMVSNPNISSMKNFFLSTIYPEYSVRVFFNPASTKVMIPCIPTVEFIAKFCDDYLLANPCEEPDSYEFSLSSSAAKLKKRISLSNNSCIICVNEIEKQVLFWEQRDGIFTMVYVEKGSQMLASEVVKIADYLPKKRHLTSACMTVKCIGKAFVVLLSTFIEGEQRLYYLDLKPGKSSVVKSVESIFRSISIKPTDPAHTNELDRFAYWRWRAASHTEILIATPMSGNNSVALIGGFLGQDLTHNICPLPFNIDSRIAKLTSMVINEKVYLIAIQASNEGTYSSKTLGIVIFGLGRDGPQLLSATHWVGKEIPRGMEGLTESHFMAIDTLLSVKGSKLTLSAFIVNKVPVSNEQDLTRTESIDVISQSFRLRL